MKELLERISKLEDELMAAKSWLKVYKIAFDNDYKQLESKLDGKPYVLQANHTWLSYNEPQPNEGPKDFQENRQKVKNTNPYFDTFPEYDPTRELEDHSDYMKWHASIMNQPAPDFADQLDSILNQQVGKRGNKTMFRLLNTLNELVKTMRLAAQGGKTK